MNNETFSVSLDCLCKPLDNLFKLFHAGGLWNLFVRDSPKDVTLCIILECLISVSISALIAPIANVVYIID